MKVELTYEMDRGVLVVTATEKPEGWRRVFGAGSAELRVTAVSFEAKPGNTFLWAENVRWLEYEEIDGHQGLYAQLRFGLAHLLPYIDHEMAMAVIARVESEFPELARQWKGRSAFGNRFLTLGL